MRALFFITLISLSPLATAAGLTLQEDPNTPDTSVSQVPRGLKLKMPTQEDYPANLPQADTGIRYSIHDPMQVNPVDKDTAKDMMDDCQDEVKKFKKTNVACYEENRHFHRIVDQLEKYCDKGRIDQAYTNFETADKMKFDFQRLLDSGTFTEALFRVDSMYPANAKVCEQYINTAKLTATRMEFLADTLESKLASAAPKTGGLNLQEQGDQPQNPAPGQPSIDSSQVSFAQH